MASRDFETLSVTHAQRARDLANRYPAAAELLSFYAELVEFQAYIFPRTHKFNSLCLLEEELVLFVSQQGSDKLQVAADQMDLSSFTQSIADYWQRRDTTSLQSFFPRVVLQPYAFSSNVEPVVLGDNVCPRCGHLPQVGVFRRQGHGRALNLVCSLCFHEWSFRRMSCPSCLEKEESQRDYYSAENFDCYHIQICDSCKKYIVLVDADKEFDAVPFVDELATLPLDIWAREQGYTKLQPNLAGI